MLTALAVLMKTFWKSSWLFGFSGIGIYSRKFSSPLGSALIAKPSSSPLSMAERDCLKACVSKTSEILCIASGMLSLAKSTSLLLRPLKAVDAKV